MPGTPGTLSTESPVSACRSIIFSGGTPNFSITSGMPICRSFIGSYMLTRRPDELHQVLVGGDDGGVGAGLAGLPRIGRDQVVRLEPLLLDAGQVEGARRLADQAELRDEIVGRRRAVRLVVGVELVAEGLRRIVENDGEMRRRHADIGVARILHQLPHHVAEAEHRAGRQAVGFAVERRQGVIGAEDVAGAVDEEEVVAFFHGRRGSALMLPVHGPQRLCQTTDRAALGRFFTRSHTVGRSIHRPGGLRKSARGWRGTGSKKGPAGDHAFVTKL